MKKLIVALAVVMVICLTGCGTTSQEVDNTVKSPFVIIYKGSDVWVFADKETKVEYVMVNNGHGGVEFQPLYNADGTLKLYEGTN